MDWNLSALGNSNTSVNAFAGKSALHQAHNESELKSLISAPTQAMMFHKNTSAASQARSDIAMRKTLVNVFAVRLTLATLVATALLSAFGALSNYSQAQQVLSCALSCTVCVTAAIHYAGILSLRGGDSNSVIFVSENTNGVKPTVLSAEEAFLQDENVDLLRHSDWLITLPLLGVELTNLLYESGVNATPSALLIAILLALVVGFGAIYRFPFKEGRLVYRKDGSATVSYRIVGLISWLIAGGLFTWVVIDLLIGANDSISKEKVVQGVAIDHRTAVMWFTIIWVLYPLVSLSYLIIIVLNNYIEGQPLSIELIVVKDICYAVLDVVSKAGLAVYITVFTLSK